MSEEAFNEIVDGFEYIRTLTEWGSKNVKYHIQRLQQENKLLKNNWNKLKKWLEKSWEESQDIWFVKIINKMQEIEQGSDSNGKDN